VNEVRRACEHILDEDRLDEKEDLKTNRLRVRDDERRGIVYLGKTLQVVALGAID
jgi:hypothetical protein